MIIFIIITIIILTPQPILGGRPVHARQSYNESTGLRLSDES
jgi:hypothetical protein